MWFARFQILIFEPQSIWCKLLVLSWIYSHYQKSPHFEWFSGQVKLSLSSHQVAVRQSSGSHQAVIRHSPCSHQAVFRQSLNSCRADIKVWKICKICLWNWKGFESFFFMKFVVCFYLVKAVLSTKMRKFPQTLIITHHSA